MEKEITIGLLNECFIKSETKDNVWLVTKTAFRFMITLDYGHFAIWKGYMNDNNQILICELKTVPLDIEERVANYYKGKEAQTWTNNN